MNDYKYMITSASYKLLKGEKYIHQVKILFLGKYSILKWDRKLHYCCLRYIFMVIIHVIVNRS